MSYEAKREEDMRNLKNAKLILSQLPDYCVNYYEFIRASASLTIVKKMRLLRRFFTFIAEERNVDIKQIPLDSLDVTDVNKFLNSIGEGKIIKASTYNQPFSFLKDFFEYNQKGEEFRLLKKLKDNDIAKQCFISEKQSREILQGVRDKAFDAWYYNGNNNYYTLKYQRDLCILEIMFILALREAEIRYLDVKDIDFKLDSIFIIGKGNKQRVLPLPHEVITDIQTYLMTRETYMKENPTHTAKWRTDCLFINVQGKGGRLTSDEIRYGVVVPHVRFVLGEDVWCSCHPVRKASGTICYENTNDLLLTSKLLNHSSVSTTLKYIQRIDKGEKGAGVVGEALGFYEPLAQ